MKLFRKAVPTALFAALGLGVAGQASADVYGLGFLDLSNLRVNIADATGGGATTYTFQTQASAILNGAASAGTNLICTQATCTNGSPVLSGPVQNAPGSAAGQTRAENDSSTKFGVTGTSYAGAESQIITSELTSLGADPAHTQQISEANLAGGSTSGGANTNIQSGTTLVLTFNVEEPGTFNITFVGNIDLLAAVTGGDTGLSSVASSMSITLNKTGTGVGSGIVADWSPDNNDFYDDCGAAYICTADNSSNIDLNIGRASSGGNSAYSGSSTYTLTVEGLQTGVYTLALGASNVTSLVRDVPVPVPGTLFLMGAGLMAGARVLRRSK